MCPWYYDNIIVQMHVCSSLQHWWYCGPGTTISVYTLPQILDRDALKLLAATVTSHASFCIQQYN